MDPLSLYYGPQEQGMATILPRVSNKRPTDVLAEQAAAQAAAAAARNKAAQDALKDLQNFDPGRFHHDVVIDMSNNLLQGVMDGTMDSYDVTREMVRMSQVTKASKVLQADYDEAMQVAKEDPRYKADQIGEYYVNTYFGDATPESALELARTGINAKGYLDDVGNAENYLDAAEVTRAVVNSQFDDMLATSEYNAGSWQSIGLAGNRIREDELRNSKLRLFAFANPETGKVEIKSPEALVEEGILETFKSNPESAALIRDRAIDLAGGDPNAVTQLNEAQALQQLLEPYKEGEVQRIEKVVGQRGAVDFSQGRERADETRSNEWLRDYRSGSTEAAAYLSGMGLDPAEVGFLVSPLFEGSDWRANMEDFQIESMVFDDNGNLTVYVMGTAKDGYKDRNGNRVSEGSIVRRGLTLKASDLPDNVLLNLYSQQKKAVKRDYTPGQQSQQPFVPGSTAAPSTGPFIPSTN